ncbi:phospholipase D family protein [Acidovorax sp. D4N7]|uniref:Phospholipase D family protein n=2 Tax=Comamonas endophytica TaxID=2949090 RepID=A0ABY6GDT0_9BURK|nr:MULTISPECIES: phospholipase D family protein [unclassified Acidovorax]MCD2513572.1 phospholipase D family protein [Acidovorax sp. D4N7]UYG53248.1 phospholipase D family protein [Acidovorax sp. 5MLIR]
MLSVLLLSFGLNACGSLPQNVDRPVSYALEQPAQTALGQWVRDRHAADKARYPSAFTLLSGAPAAYGGRLALIEGAQKTLDLQYYAIHADTSSGRLLRELVAAAERGVRVRILLDDFHSVGTNAQVLRLGFVPNIEMRLFNPLVGPRNSTVGRIFSTLTDIHRAQQRMHNKLFIADNVIGIAGGRNLGDAYFDQHESGNFIDLDVMAAGPIVRDLSRSFDSYWNDQRAYPVSSLISREKLERMESAEQAKTREAVQASAAPAAPDSASAQHSRTIWDQKPMDLNQAPWVWAPAVVLADEPTKIALEGEGPTPGAATGAAAPGTANAATREASPSPATTEEPAPAALPLEPPGLRPGTGTMAVRQGASIAPAELQAETVVDGLLTMMGRARQDLLIVSPYFVPGEDMKQAFAKATQRGVRVRVLTNSLASNDAPAAHAGYARHRKELLAMGVQLYEMRSESADLRNSLSSGSGPGASRAMLHSKVLILDGSLVAIGSMNLDLRSQLHNTEIALLIASPSVGRVATENIEAALTQSAWKVELVDGKRLLWRAPQGSGLEDAHNEPDVSLPMRWLLQLLGPLAPDHLL